MMSGFVLCFLLLSKQAILLRPMAPAIFYLRGISPPEIRLVDMYKGVLPFIALEFICLGLIMAFPDLALKLPELLFERVAKGTPY